MDYDYDVIIIGARIAGSVLGTLLGRHGTKVLVLDRAHFPSDTLSTHFFRWPTFTVFGRIGVLESVTSQAPKLANNFNYIDGHVFSEEVEGPEGPSHHLCIRRITLDHILVQRLLKESSVLLREGAIVSELITSQGRVEGVRWSEKGKQMEATGRAVIGADGINSVVARNVEIEIERSEPVHRAMYYAYYRNLEGWPNPSAEFHYRGNHLAYVFPTDGGLSLLAASIPIDEFAAFKRDPERNLADFFASMPELKPRIDKAQKEGPVRGTGSIPAYRRVPFGKGWALVGDSAQIMDPWSGQGIDQASTHASLFADSVIEWLSERKSWEDAMKEYQRKRNEFSDAAFDRTCRAAPDLRPMTKAALKRRGLARES